MLRSWRVLLLIVALAFAGCGRAPDARQSAETFFRLISEGKTEEAHASAAFAFQVEQNVRVFDQTAKELGLIGSSKVELEPIESEPKEAKFNATITTATGEQRVYVATLQKDGGTWRIFSLRTPKNPNTGRALNHFSLVGRGAAFRDPLSQPMPDPATLQRIVHEAMSLFNDALQKESFSDFYQNVAIGWQAQLTERQLQRAFQPFIDQKVDLTEALKGTPVFDPEPQITTEGLLLVSGHYPSTPYNVGFALKFIYELPEWKLFGIDVHLKKAEGPGTRDEG